jgi:nucleotide-binding universal stress UspA family protein
VADFLHEFRYFAAAETGRRAADLGWTRAAAVVHALGMDIQIRRILVPIDFSDHAEVIIEWASHLAVEHESEIILLHVYHLPIEFQQVEGAYLPADFWNTVKEEALRSLSKYGDQLRARGLAVREVTREGYPATVIEEEVEREDADMVVIGTRGRTGLGHMLLGSIAERVVQKAACPVLTVKLRES